MKWIFIKINIYLLLTNFQIILKFKSNDSFCEKLFLKNMFLKEIKIQTNCKQVIDLIKR